MKLSRPTIAAAALLAIATTPAHAQDVSSVTREAPRQQRDRIVIGVGAAAIPTYQGSDDYRVLPIPVIDIAKGRFFANLRNGIGVNVIDGGPVTIGGSVALMPGYRRKDVPDGVDRVTVGGGGRLFANLKAGGAILTVGGTKGFAGSTKGVIADASLSYPVVASRRLILIPAIGTSWADRKHNDRYFGINAREALASGLPEYRLGGGFKDVTAGVTANYRLNRRLSLAASANVSTLLGDAKDSPLVERKTQPTGFLSLNYLFGR
ncbi:MipA/OmpV family protein [Sphingomonas aracearum]|uniref:MipA/OmpV family protein n=1 Tax=Sphingomonas aracearum TaxID=2283317 RepID=A0A369W5L0_9SPHN|nr:MipA/OmpV family protein [Sphingomonas aracearum]RDE07371.1 MipA/OmpV family protein [Sphingomonas aracearum]